MASRLLFKLATALVRRSAGRQTPPTQPGRHRCLPTAFFNPAAIVVVSVTIRSAMRCDVARQMPWRAIRGKELHTCRSWFVSYRFGTEAGQEEQGARHHDIEADQRKECVNTGGGSQQQDHSEDDRDDAVQNLAG